MEEKNTNNFYKNLMIIIITALITCIITTVVIYNYFISRIGVSNSNDKVGNIVTGIVTGLTGKKSNSDDSIESQLSQINTKLNDVYIGEIDEQKMKEGALEGYVAGLGDEYTEYLTEK